MQKNSFGFSLVEISVSLVVIAAIIAGVVSGASLIQQSKLRAQISQLTQYDVAFKGFKLAYGAMPGDLKDATAYWPGQTNNGNEDGRITNNSGEGDADGTSLNGEMLEFFRHLSLAKMVDGSFDGTDTIGTGYPRLKYEQSSGMFAADFWRENSTFGAYGSPDNIGKLVLNHPFLALMSCLPEISVTHGKNNCSIFVPKDIQNIDEKIDDGITREGRFLGFGSCCNSDYTFQCALASNFDKYNLASEAKECVAQYRL